MTERCVCCGEIIPEGRQVCPICERNAGAEVMANEKLIRASEAKAKLKAFHDWFGGPVQLQGDLLARKVIEKCIEEIDKLEQVDTAPVVNGNWNIRCETHRDYSTGEVDEDFYLECSVCNRKVWDVSQDDVLLGRYGKICSDYPYCHCGAKMDLEVTNGS